MSSDNVLDQVHQKLTQRLAQARREIAIDEAALASLRERQGSHEVVDPAELAGDAAVAEVLEPAEQILLREALQLEAAVHRIAEGNYGLCVDCNQPIPVARLEAQPAGERCLSCQAAFESGATRR